MNSKKNLIKRIEKGEFNHPAHIVSSDYTMFKIQNKNQELKIFNKEDFLTFIKNELKLKNLTIEELKNEIYLTKGWFVSEFINIKEFKKAEMDRESKKEEIMNDFKKELIQTFCNSENKNIQNFLVNKAIKDTRTKHAAVEKMEYISNLTKDLEEIK